MTFFLGMSLPSMSDLLEEVNTRAGDNPINVIIIKETLLEL